LKSWKLEVIVLLVLEVFGTLKVRAPEMIGAA
jgi:hypothetical protein